MDIEKIRTLIALMEESELVNLEISSDDEHISLTRHYDAPAPTMMAASAAPAAAVEGKPAEKAGSVESSPMVGVFYSAPSPNDPPFVKVGQKVQAGDTLGIIEAMKIMNPLEATQSGIVDEILVDNSEVVQFGQPVIRYKA
ncbi:MULTISPECIES: acetyl-CoA carboxylase biotin carboxyl carrier protein [Psychrobacter]|jgi:acetyl-CoA carboxylase biotin carboxyl carrier protein|uniref:acetyl-CoA carboxylase biotin carboxyl carrier protein n=1 Tax=Psychrobacter TaxID=497 RepID=UPI00086E4802|nr:MULTISPECIES: acetyl-CoA carboxylase biotin carboxyl carrier protein [Psychrobacter]MBA6245325.1 acetyl-CoA carboxylase biotin carboxyl carrier protein [Psychrobacter sp. Urea-trap-18]MBA6285726.1 acetyl-CoA carboxylase biotin carboxyl carrier protein [Psychrobacter sp. Urea-trap-16]MBA6318973.1 acetyl-CoA carboxylase biotin carboxyl carrier protein [Psychrobacter sp. Urea-trap-20]MBA6333886.1 acetyl-CoA carboxylase biotin carboxyl carrier protein [Psychrobacter sp. Urea-trap-19]MCG3842953.|tara:strand:- start:693 stop:1115 length:423 start_codon:yes stop_codon:yes gene_type:complete